MPFLPRGFAALYAVTLAGCISGCRFGYELVTDDLAGGAGSGGASELSGGSSTGAASAAGGASTGGVSTGSGAGGSGGSSAGGASTGGNSTGGMATGGDSTGGASTGGAGTGGGGGSAPFASFTRSPGVGETTTSFAFDGGASTDPEDGVPTAWAWDFESDGTYDASGATTNHTFVSAGDYTVTLQVTDSVGNTATATRTVLVAEAGSLLVITTGSDENDGSATPTLSLREAINFSNATFGRQTIILGSGITAAPSSNLPIFTDGADFVGDGGVIDGTAIGANRNCLNSQSSGTRFLDLEITGCPNNGIQIQNLDNNEVRGCYIHDVGGGGIFTAGSQGHIIDGNEISSSGGFGVSINSNTTSVLNNYIHGTTNVAVDLGGGATGSNIDANLVSGGSVGIQVGAASVTVWFNSVVGSTLHAMQVSTGPVDLRNNILAFATQYGVVSAQSNFSFFDYNVLYGNGSGPTDNCTCGANCVFTNPNFASVGTSCLLSAGSPAIDTGTSVSFDKNGSAPDLYNGTAPDIGCGEAP